MDGRGRWASFDRAKHSHDANDDGHVNGAVQRFHGRGRCGNERPPCTFVTRATLRRPERAHNCGDPSAARAGMEFATIGWRSGGTVSVVLDGPCEASPLPQSPRGPLCLGGLRSFLPHGGRVACSGGARTECARDHAHHRREEQHVHREQQRGEQQAPHDHRRERHEGAGLVRGADGARLQPDHGEG